MKNTEIISARHSQRNIQATLFCAALYILCLFTGIISFSVKVHAKTIDTTTLNYDLQTLSTDALKSKIPTGDINDLQSLIDGEFCENAMNGNVQTYVQSIIKNPLFSPNLTDYTKALAASLNLAVESDEKINPASVQKAVITLCMCLEYNASNYSVSDLLSTATIDYALNHTIGEKGIMSYIYGLKMLDTLESSGCSFCASHTREEIINILLSLQLSDGGYALTGNDGDVDVTSMTLQSLAPVYQYASVFDKQAKASSYSFSPEEYLSICESVNSSISFLKSVQLEDGGFSSYGNASSESTAQVIITVADFGLDINSFIKNDNSLFDALLNYRMPDGSFSHTASPLVSNDMSTAQSLEAFSTYLNTTGILPAEAGAPSTFIPASTSSESAYRNPALKESAAPTTGVKFYLYIAIAALLVLSFAAFTVLYFFKKNRKKYILRLLSSVIVAAFAALAVYFINIQSKEAYESTPGNIIAVSPSSDTITVSFSINCSVVASDSIPAFVYSSEKLSVAEDTTVFDLLTEVCRLNSIQLDYESNSIYGTAYIKGINSLYEYDYGDLSGWMYRVNGEFPSVGCAYYTLSDGDVIEWVYTKDLGRDLK